MRLAGVALALALVFSVAGTVLALRNEQAERDRVTDQSFTLARAAATDTDRFLRDRIDVLQVLAVTPSVRAGDVEQMPFTFLQARAAEPSLTFLAWADASGHIRAVGTPAPPDQPIDIADRDYFREVMSTGQPYISAALVLRNSQASRPALAVAVPTHGPDGAVHGVLINTITLEQLDPSLALYSLAHGTTVLIADRSGHLVVGGDPSDLTDVSMAPVLARARSEGEGVRADTRGVRGQPGRLVAYATVPTAGWVVFIERPAAEAFATARRTVTVTFAALLIVAITGLAGALLVGRRLDRLTEEQRRALRESEALREVARVAGGRLRVSEAARTVVVQARRLFRADLAAVATVPSGETSPRWAAVAGAQAYDPDDADRTPPRIVERVVAAGGAVIFERLDERGEDACRLPLHAREKLRTSLSVPLMRRAEIIGALTVGWRRDRAVTAEDVRLAEGLASSTSVALDNARLFEEAQEAVRVRNEFLSTVTHDLKSPLAAIKGMAQLLRRRATQPGPVDADKLVEGLDAIDATTSRMTAMIGELLDLAHLQAGQPLELERRSLDLAELVSAQVDAQRATTERHQLRTEIPSDGMRAELDPSRIERVVGNLLSNAIKYSPEGGEIVVSLRREPDDTAVLAVQDHGLGIPAADLPRIFERFHRAGNVAGRFQGTGIGLSSARQIVEQHGGGMAVESVEGEGTTVTVRLPLSPRPEPQSAA